MNVIVDTPYGRLVLTALNRSDASNPYDHCCFAGDLVLETQVYAAQLSMMRPPGKQTWQMVDIAAHANLPRPWSISLSPADENTRRQCALDIPERECWELNVAQLVACVFTAVFLEIRLIHQAPLWKEWIRLDSGLDDHIRRYRVGRQTALLQSEFRGSGR